jgi:hypothetical protein
MYTEIQSFKLGDLADSDGRVLLKEIVRYRDFYIIPNIDLRDKFLKDNPNELYFTVEELLVLFAMAPDKEDLEMITRVKRAFHPAEVIKQPQPIHTLPCYPYD